jgi:hypothetical protein
MKKTKIILNINRDNLINFKIRTFSYNINSDHFISFLMKKFASYDINLEELYKEFLLENNLKYTKRMEEAFVEINRAQELKMPSTEVSDISEEEILKLKNK